MAYSIRENIAQNMFQTLDEYKNTTDQNILKKVVRNPIVLEEISRESFPVAYVESSDEEREDVTMSGTRMGTISYIINVFVHGGEGDAKRNDLIQLIEDALEVDRTRGGYALDTELVNIEILNEQDFVPYYGIALTIDCMYCYQKGNN